MNAITKAGLGTLPVVLAAAWLYGPQVQRQGPVTLRVPDTVRVREAVRVRGGTDTVFYRDTLRLVQGVDSVRTARNPGTTKYWGDPPQIGFARNHWTHRVIADCNRFIDTLMVAKPWRMEVFRGTNAYVYRNKGMGREVGLDRAYNGCVLTEERQ